MAEFQLIAARPLEGYDRRFGEIALRAPADLALVSVALPLRGEDGAQKAVKAGYGTALPDVGRACAAKDNTILLRMSRDQGFVLFTHATPDAERVVAEKLKGAAYTTDQTDVWAALEISGPGARAALMRICPLDLDDGAFEVMDAARTVMEHLGTIIIRIGPEAWLLLSASSSAGSFLHALETSIRNVG